MMYSPVCVCPERHPRRQVSRDVTHLNDAGDNADFRFLDITHTKKGLPATQLLESRQSKNTASFIVH